MLHGSWLKAKGGARVGGGGRWGPAAMSHEPLSMNKRLITGYQCCQFPPYDAAAAEASRFPSEESCGRRLPLALPLHEVVVRPIDVLVVHEVLNLRAMRSTGLVRSWTPEKPQERCPDSASASSVAADEGATRTSGDSVLEQS